jgi:hypothetical protein
MMKNLDLTANQRLNIFAIVEGREGTAAEFRLYSKIMDKLELSEEEKDAIGYKEQELPDGQVMRIIPEGKGDDNPKTISFEDAEFSKLKELFSGRIPRLNLGHRKWLMPLLDQLGI